jgi:hypothetical protein
MARSYLVPIDLNKNELQNARIQNLAADPGSPVEGQIYHNTVDHRLYVYNGTAFEALDNDTAAELLTKLLTVDGSGSGLDADLLDGQSSAYYLARANHTGTQLAATVSDFDTQVRTNRLDQLAAPTADVSLNSHKLTNVTTPSASGDAATKGYVDSAITGLDWKASVRAATTTAGTLTTDYENGDTLDGVTLATGDRILIKNQATAADNGIYVVAASGAPARATDADANAEVTAGLAVFVTEGTTNADTGWVLTTNDAITVGSTGLTFAQFTGGSTYTAGAGLALSGSDLSVNVDNSSIEINSDTLRVKAGGVTDTMLATAHPKKYSATIGDGAATSIAITQATHGCASDRTNMAIVMDATSGAQVYPDITYGGTGTVTFAFAVAPTTNQYRVNIVG